MGLPRLFLLKQLFTKPTNSHFNLTRTLCDVPPKPPSILSPKFVQFVQNSPQSSVIPLLEKHFSMDKCLLESEVPRIIRDFRKLKRFDRALEVLEWSNRKPVYHILSVDLPLRLDLVGMVHGVAAAEEFFKEANDHSEKMCSSLLDLYVQENRVDKSLALFKKMKAIGFGSSPHTFNKVMSLCKKNQRVDQLLDLLSEMQDKVSYKLCLKACASSSDSDSMDMFVKSIEDQHDLFDWLTYTSVANYYVDKGHPEKAISCLQKAEYLVRDSSEGYKVLISLYAKLGDATRVTKLWEKRKKVFKSCSNNDYMVMLSSLMKLYMFEQAEGLFEEWKASGNGYDHVVLDAVLSGYAQKGMVGEAEKILEDLISKNMTPVPISWGILSEGYVNCHNMQKAVQCMKKALQLGPQLKGWAPKRAVISKILKSLADDGDSDQMYELLMLMSRVVPVSEDPYLLLKARSKRGKFIIGILQRLKDDNIDVDRVMRLEA